MLRLRDGYPNTSPELKEEVKVLQKLLKITADGLFGPGTEKALRRFQALNGLEPTGILDQSTGVKLNYPKKPTTSFLDSMLLRFQTYKVHAVTSSKSFQIPVPVIFGIGVRESHWGAILRSDLTGDCAGRTPKGARQGRLPVDGCFGRGLMQIDYDYHEFARTGAWVDPAKNIAYACQVLRDEVLFFRQRGYYTRCALAAYNCGRGNVLRALRNDLSVDFYTTGRNYSSDVIRMADWYRLVEGDQDETNCGNWTD